MNFIFNGIGQDIFYGLFMLKHVCTIYEFGIQYTHTHITYDAYI